MLQIDMRDLRLKDLNRPVRVGDLLGGVLPSRLKSYLEHGFQSDLIAAARLIGKDVRRAALS